jgi:hypothetical protein
MIFRLVDNYKMVSAFARSMGDCSHLLGEVGPMKGAASHLKGHGYQFILPDPPYPVNSLATLLLMIDPNLGWSKEGPIFELVAMQVRSSSALRFSESNFRSSRSKLERILFELPSSALGPFWKMDANL